MLTFSGLRDVRRIEVRRDIASRPPAQQKGAGATETSIVYSFS